MLNVTVVLISHSKGSVGNYHNVESTAFENGNYVLTREGAKSIYPMAQVLRITEQSDEEYARSCYR